MLSATTAVLDRTAARSADFPVWQAAGGEKKQPRQRKVKRGRLAQGSLSFGWRTTYTPKPAPPARLGQAPSVPPRCAAPRSGLLWRRRVYAASKRLVAVMLVRSIRGRGASAVGVWVGGGGKN